MRILFIYLLSLFLFKGHSPDFSGTQQYPLFRAISQNVDKTECSTTPDWPYLPDFSLLNDDNDDEFSPEKKKSAGSRVSSVFSCSIFMKSYTGSLKCPPPSFNSFFYCFPDKYIFQRAIRI